MKLFRDTLFLFALFSNPVIADNLCDASCNLHINFTQSGWLEATDALTISFGSGAVINDGHVATGYAADETLQLVAGERLEFGAGGVLDRGDGGNITLSASGGNQSVSLHGDSIIAVNGNLDIASNLIVASQLDFSSNTTLTGQGSVTVESPGYVSLGDSSAILTSFPIDTAPTISGQTISFVANGSMSVENFNIEFTPILSGGELTISVLTQSDLVKFEGESFSLDNGASCTVQQGVCIDDQGVSYKVVDGRFVAETSDNGSSGSLNLQMLILLCAGYLLTQRPGRLYSGFQ